MAFTYLIGWSKLNTWYYGVRYKKGSLPSDLWTKYFTSSNYVKAFRLLNGEPDIVEIRKIFDNTLKSKKWENKVLKRMNVVNDDKWLNKHDKNAPPILLGHTHNRGRLQTEEIKEKRRQSMIETMAKKFPNRKIKTRFDSKEYKDNMAISVKKKWEKLTPEEKKSIGNKISSKLKGKPLTGNGGSLWWNNGIINTRNKVCPGEEWTRGKLKINGRT